MTTESVRQSIDDVDRTTVLARSRDTRTLRIAAITAVLTVLFSAVAAGGVLWIAAGEERDDAEQQREIDALLEVSKQQGTVIDQQGEIIEQLRHDAATRDRAIAQADENINVLVAEIERGNTTSEANRRLLSDVLEELRAHSAHEDPSPRPGPTPSPRPEPSPSSSPSPTPDPRPTPTPDFVCAITGICEVPIEQEA